MARRKNATFTLDKTYGKTYWRDGDYIMIQGFYYELNKIYPGNTPIPIPPKSRVHPTKRDPATLGLIFADFSVRKFAPIALRAVGLEAQAVQLEQLDPITSRRTARATIDATNDAERAAAAAPAALAAAAVRYAAEAADHAAYAAVDAASATHTAPYTAHAVANAAKLDPDATWAAVNEMLQAL